MIMLSNVRFGLGHKIWPNPDKKNETVNLGFRLSVLGSTSLKPGFFAQKMWFFDYKAGNNSR